MNVSETYRKSEMHSYDCDFMNENRGMCWGQVKLVGYDTTGEGTTVYMCEGHASIYLDGDMEYCGEYLPERIENNG